MDIFVVRQRIFLFWYFFSKLFLWIFFYFIVFSFFCH